MKLVSKIKNLNVSKNIKKFFKNTKFSLKRTVATAIIPVVLLSSVGCEQKDKNVSSDVTTSISTDVESEKNISSMSDEEINSIIIKKNESNSSTQEEKVKVTEIHEYTQQNWDNYVNSMWKLVSGKINNINKESFTTAMMLLNNDYIKANNINILYKYFDDSNGIDMEDELNQLFSILSQIRAYNLSAKSEKEFFPLINLLSDKSELSTLSVIEQNATKAVELNNKLEKGNVTEDDYKQAQQIFNTMNDFQMGKIKINGLSAAQLSKGGIFVCEEDMKIISVMLRNFQKYDKKVYISEEDLKTFTESLNSSRVLSQIQAEWNYMSGGVDMMNPPTSADEVIRIYNMVEEQRELIYKEVSKMGVTKEEVDALYTIANIDYFIKDSNNKVVFNRLYNNGFDLAETLSLAESAVSKIEIYNMSVKSVNNLYDYTHFFIESKEDIISVMYVVNTAYTMHNGSKAEILTSAKNLVDYSAYSNKAAIVIDLDSGKGDGSTTQLKIDKNSLNLGGTQVVNLISYYAFLNNQSKIDNNQLVKDGIALVDGTTEISDVQSQISVAVDGICLNKDSVLKYQIGQKK